MNNADRDLIAKSFGGPFPLAVGTSALAAELSTQILQAGPGEICLSFVVGDRFTQATGVLQGGAVASMLDFGLAFAALTLRGPGESAVTLSLAINYLRPALPGSYEVHAKVIRAGRRLTFVEASLLGPAGDAVATASSPLLNS